MDAFRLLYASHVRPRLEYGGAATYPCTAGELVKLERVQSVATRLVVGLRGTSYEGCLQATAIVVEEKTDAAFERCLDEHLKGQWRNENLWSDLRPSGDGVYTGTLPSALNPED
ncbi:unnamed protein product [Echinostoma caproni]|uniref:ASCH domain-containing protein n=1 Tax=Echinostoma caproni TaxID=27848 RepID=A0A183A595_9TREM|nr:unnamed protein product [Echinostoma caproni]